MSLIATGTAPAAYRSVPHWAIPTPVTFTVESGFISLAASEGPLGSDTAAAPGTLTITKRATVSLAPGDSGHRLDTVIKAETLAPNAQADAPAPGSIPVILVHGTAENQKYWDAMKSSLQVAGMQAYAFDYGQNGFQGLVGSIGKKIGLRGFGDVEVSTQQLANQVATVLGQTGAGKVDLVGHSQGGLLIKNFVAQDKTDRVANVVQLAPSTHGTTFSGLADFIGPVGNSVDINGWKPVKDVIYSAASALAWPSLSQQTVGSPFLDKLDKLPDTKPGVDYLVVSTKDDVVATPYKSQFITAAPGSTTVNIEVHSLPGVPRDGQVDHGLNTGDVISAVTNYLKSSQSAQRSLDQVKANPGTTLTKDGATTTVSEGGKVVATIDDRPGPAKENAAKQSRESTGKAATGTTVITPSGAALEVAGRDVTLTRKGQSVSISDTNGVTVSNSPADQAPSIKRSAQTDRPASPPKVDRSTNAGVTTAKSPPTAGDTKESPARADSDKKPTARETNGITPKIGIGANGITGHSGTTKPPTTPEKNATASAGTAAGAHTINGTSAHPGSSNGLGGQRTSSSNGSPEAAGSGSAASTTDSKPGHSDSGSASSGSGSGEHKKPAAASSHEHSAGGS